MFEKFFLTLFKLMLKNNLNMGYYMYYTYICRHIKYDIYMYITK